MAGRLLQQRTQPVGMQVLDPGARPVLQGPAGLLNPPAELHVAARADSLLEAADALPGPAPDQQVRGDPGGQRLPLDVEALVEVAPGPRVARDQAALLGRPDHASGEDSDAGGRRIGEVVVEQRGGRSDVGVEEEQPIAARRCRTDVARVVGGALGRGGDEVRAGAREIHQAGGHAVVGDDQLVGLAQVQALEPRQRPQPLRPLAGEGHDDADGRPRPLARRHQLLRRRSGPDLPRAIALS